MRIKFFIITLFSLVGKETAGQQNLFNIPSGDVTLKNKVFYQHQLNVYRSKLESKAHFVYGLGKGWDAGVNLVGKGFYFSPEWRALYNSNSAEGALYPILLGTLQKQFVVTKKFRLNLGVQAGPNLTRRLENKRLNYFLYGLGVYHFGEGSRIVTGVYHGNRMYLGTGNTTGIVGGYEIKLHKRLYLMGDWISGRNDASVAVIGSMYNVAKRVQLCAGWQVPNPGTLKPPGLVLEVNLTTWDVF